MMNITSLGKKVSILGLGKSGYQSALFLQSKGFHLFVSDQGASSDLDRRADELRRKKIEVETGEHSLDKILASDWVLISPGIGPTSGVYEAVKQSGLPLYSEIEVASWFSPSSNIIAVTGTSGKTTVTTLLARVFERAFGKSICAGNIGNPWIGELKNINSGDFVVLEVSSFQLMHCESFRPKVGVLLNLSSNHQDWHRSMQEYARAKLRLFANQGPDDWALYRRADGLNYFEDFIFQGKALLLDEIENKNLNETAVRLVASIFKIPSTLVDKVLSDFEGIEHRLEKVVTDDGITYINDSKCTTTASLAWALQKYPDKSVVLIAGGHPKTKEFGDVRDWLCKKVKRAVLVGEARSILRESWKGVCEMEEAEDFRDAVKRAKAAARSGETVLLSPACASFDMFKNYEDGGHCFKQIVFELIASKSTKVLSA